MTPRAYIGAVAGLLVALFAVSWYREHHPTPSPEQQAAHQATIEAEQKAARVDTLYLNAKDSAAVARTRYRTLHDTVLAHLTDTVLVKEALWRADTTIVRDSVALVRADSSLAAERDVTKHVRGELAIALRPHPEPRLRTSVYGLYEPLTATPALAAQLTARVIGQVTLVARADQRLVIGERARLSVGAGVTF